MIAVLHNWDRYFGGGETFLFQLLPTFAVYRWDSANRAETAIADGGGGGADGGSGSADGGSGSGGSADGNIRSGGSGDASANGGAATDVETGGSGAGDGGSAKPRGYFMLADMEKIAIGGGGSGHGLELDQELGECRSSRCDTFDNEPFAEDGHTTFKCASVEAWAVH
jgi:hypothetical protein